MKPITPPFEQILEKAIAEAVGVFSLVFTGCGAMMVAERFPGSIVPQAIPIIFGLIVAVMVYTIGHISGAHINPAVTLAFAVTRHFPKKQVLVYWLAQSIGSILAIFALSLLLPAGETFGATVPVVSLGKALGWEIILTFFLMFAVMGTATDTRAVGAMAGSAIGATVMLASFLGGPITGASMNPARSLGPALFQGNLDIFWLYIVGPMVGAVIAALLYERIRCEITGSSKKDVEGAH